MQLVSHIAFALVGITYLAAGVTFYFLSYKAFTDKLLDFLARTMFGAMLFIVGTSIIALVLILTSMYLDFYALKF